MTNNSNSSTTFVNLEHFDFLNLLKMLAEGQKTGLLTVTQNATTFKCWLERGRICQLEFGKQRGLEALSALLLDQRGQFHFEEGSAAPAPGLNLNADVAALQALAALPPLPLPFAGPARITAPERLSEMPWTIDEERVLRRIEQQTPLSELEHDPVARRLLSGFARLGLLKARKSRVARLTVGVTREVRGVVVVDSHIVQRWKDDLVRHPQKLAIRDEAGNTYTFALREGPNLGTDILFAPDLIMQTSLRSGDSVLVKPV